MAIIISLLIGGCIGFLAAAFIGGAATANAINQLHQNNN